MILFVKVSGEEDLWLFLTSRPNCICWSELYGNRCNKRLSVRILRHNDRFWLNVCFRKNDRFVFNFFFQLFVRQLPFVKKLYKKKKAFFFLVSTVIFYEVKVKHSFLNLFSSLLTLHRCHIWKKKKKNLVDVRWNHLDQVILCTNKGSNSGLEKKLPSIFNSNKSWEKWIIVK